MQTLLLECGQMVILDDEDYEWATPIHWYVRDRPDRPRTIIRDEVIGLRVFRIFLHRAIAIRMRPDLEPVVARMRVKAINGDYTDVRRDNLEVRLNSGKGKTGHVAKPHGTALKRYNYRLPPISVDDIPTHGSPLWTGGLANSSTKFDLVDAKFAPRTGRVSCYRFAGRLVVRGDEPVRGLLRKGDPGSGDAGDAGRPASPEILSDGGAEGGGLHRTPAPAPGEGES